jgi:polyisoprenoid-binding protein YceI
MATERYEIDPSRSSVTIDASSSVHPIHSQTKGLEGWLELELLDDGRVNLAAPPAARLSLPVEQLKSGNPLEDRELRRRIDARRYRTIDGELTGMTQGGRAGVYRVRGDITFRGVTRSYEDEMTFTRRDAGTIAVTGHSTFDIRQFGMEPPKVLMLRVHPEVRVAIEVVATKDP